MSLLDDTLNHLRVLVGYDTRNPPRTIGTEGLFDYLRAQLHGFDCTLSDHGAGAVSLFAVRGKPRLLFNVHLDTVPDSPKWSADPFELRVDAGRAIGLGACDIKGAAAALLSVAGAGDGDLALLLTTDEEGANPRCIGNFLSSAPRVFDAVIVAEPTRCEAVLAHRGIATARARFAGCAGHASGVQSITDSAVHRAARWAVLALDHAAAQAHARFGGLSGLRFNIGRIEGGIKANMIAPECEVRFGFRPLPSMDVDALLNTFRDCARPPADEFAETFRGAPLPAGDVADAEAGRLAARDLADELGIPVGNAVDFWTEAALFSQAGCTAFVFGPGDIAQAHSADEWVALDQLRDYANAVYRIVENGHA